MPVFLLFSWCSHFISLSSSQPQATVLRVILLALFFTTTFVLQQTVNLCLLWSTKTLLPCDSRQKEWAVHLEMTRKLVLTLSLVAFSVCCVLNAIFTTSTHLNYLSITFCKSPFCDKSCDTFKNLKFRFLNIQFLYVHHDALLLSLFCDECYIHQNKVRLSSFFDSMSSLYFFWTSNKINHPPFSMKKFSMPWMHFVRFIFNLLSVEENNSNDFVLVSNLKHSFGYFASFLTSLLRVRDLCLSHTACSSWLGLKGLGKSKACTRNQTSFFCLATLPFT